MKPRSGEVIVNRVRPKGVPGGMVINLESRSDDVMRMINYVPSYNIMPPAFLLYLFNTLHFLASLGHAGLTTMTPFHGSDFIFNISTINFNCFFFTG